FKYIYIKKFNEIKMLKGNLLQFPFPVLTGYEKNVLDKKVQNYLDNRKDRYLKEIDKIVFTSFQLNPDEIGYINKSV
ncbi:MAG: hypothetical protein LUB59_06860, partial [Candidatus Gastranaerophilales bacterium]|nr:hypothetical protein [Candidatus Gastranaerophilales bacterium]